MLEEGDFWDDVIFGDVYEKNKKREQFLRRPEHLPDDADIRAIRTYILSIIKKYTDKFEFLTTAKFVELRCSYLAVNYFEWSP